MVALKDSCGSKARDTELKTLATGGDGSEPRRRAECRTPCEAIPCQRVVQEQKTDGFGLPPRSRLPPKEYHGAAVVAGPRRKPGWITIPSLSSPGASPFPHRLLRTIVFR